MDLSLASHHHDDREQLDLTAVDLNLLIVLNSLLRHRNITHAGTELCLSQPATSRALARLRSMFDDDLLTRSNRAFKLTPLAEALVPKVQSTLGNIDKVFTQAVVAPRRFTIAMPDHIALHLLPKLKTYFDELSPDTLLLPIVRFSNLLNQMENGLIDIAIGTAEDAPSGFFCRSLPPIPSLALVREGHPLLRSDKTAQDIGRFPSIRIGSHRDNHFGEVSDGLESIRHRAREVCSVPDIQTAARMVKNTDAILVLPTPSAQFIGKRFNLETFVPNRAHPLPDYQISLIWHERWHRNTLHSGVRNTIAARIISH